MKGTLRRRLAKAKSKPTVSIAIRFPRENVQTLAEIEETTDLAYEEIVRMLVKRFCRVWDKDKKFTLPIAIIVMDFEDAVEQGLIERERTEKGKKPKEGEVTWLSGKENKKKNKGK